MWRRCCEKVTDYIDEGYPVDIILLDFQKALDKVLQARLFLKVNALGIGGGGEKGVRLDWVMVKGQEATCCN